jgi:hypothetical protein
LDKIKSKQAWKELNINSINGRTNNYTEKHLTHLNRMNNKEVDTSNLTEPTEIILVQRRKKQKLKIMMPALPAGMAIL